MSQRKYELNNRFSITEKCLDSLPSPPVTAIPKITNGTVNSVITPKTTCIPPPTGEGPVSGPKRSTANGLLGDGQSKGSDGLSSDSVVDDRLLHPITGPYTEQKGNFIERVSRLEDVGLFQSMLSIIRRSPVCDVCRTAHSFESGPSVGSRLPKLRSLRRFSDQH